MPAEGRERVVESAITSCARCALSRLGRAVAGEGPCPARIAIVGEAPGAEEERLGRPFVGPAGRLLDRALAAAGIDRAACYVTNVCKCRPPSNRTPRPEEVASCVAYLVDELCLVAPRVVLCLGGTAARTLFDPDARVGRDQGRVARCLGYPDALAVVTWHPAYILRQSGEDMDRAKWQMFRALLRVRKLAGL